MYRIDETVGEAEIYRHDSGDKLLYFKCDN